MGIFTKGGSKTAFSGELMCPICHSTKQKFVGDVARYRQRYQCKKCGSFYQYDYSGRIEHPYAPFKKSKFQRIVEASKKYN